MVQSGHPSFSGAETRGQKGHLGNGVNLHSEDENKRSERQCSSPCWHVLGPGSPPQCCQSPSFLLPAPGLALNCDSRDTGLGGQGLLIGRCQTTAQASY